MNAAVHASFDLIDVNVFIQTFCVYLFMGYNTFSKRIKAMDSEIQCIFCNQFRTGTRNVREKISAFGKLVLEYVKLWPIQKTMTLHMIVLTRKKEG